MEADRGPARRVQEGEYRLAHQAEPLLPARRREERMGDAKSRALAGREVSLTRLETHCAIAYMDVSYCMAVLTERLRTRVQEG